MSDEETISGDAYISCGAGLTEAVIIFSEFLGKRIQNAWF